MRVSGGKVQNAGGTGLPTAFKQEQPKEEKPVNQVKKSPNKKVSAKNKKKKKSKIWIVPVAIVAVVALLIVMVVVKKSSGNKNGVSAQDAYNSWSYLVQSGSFDALATANEAGNKGYLYQEISYNNDNPIYAKMKKAVLAKTEYSLPQVEETGLFNKGEKRQGDLNKDNITLARTTLDWSKVPVNRVDIQQAIQAWKVDKLAEDTAKNKASKDSSNTSTSDDKEPSLDDYTNSINSVSYNIDSAEIFAEWAVIITKQATGLRTTKQISKNEMISEGAAGYSASVAEDEYLDKVLFSSDDFINCMNDFQNQLYLMSGGQADENTTKQVFGIKDISDTSGMGSDAPQGKTTDGKDASNNGQNKDGNTDSKDDSASAQNQDNGDKDASKDSKDEQDSSKTKKEDFEDVDPQRDGLQIYDYDTDIKGIQLKDGTVLKDSDPNKPGVQLDDGTTVEGIPVPDEKKDLADHKKNVLTDLVKDRWVIDKTWVGTYRLLSGKTKVIPQKGDGSFDNPATVGTRLNYTQPGKDKDGKPVDNPLNVTLTEFRVGGDAIKWYETKDSRNRGFDVRSNSIQVGMVFTVTNTGSNEVTFGDDSTLSDNSGNPTYRTGNVFGLKDSVTLKPGQTGKIETWTAATAITEKYIIWGSSYMANKLKDPLYFRVLKAADNKTVSGQSAQDLAGTAGRCANSEAGCEVEGNSTAADAIPGTALSGTTTGGERHDTTGNKKTYEGSVD